METILVYSIVYLVSVEISLVLKTVPYVRGKIEQWRLDTFVKLENLNINTDDKIDSTASFDERIRGQIYSKIVDI